MKSISFASLFVLAALPVHAASFTVPSFTLSGPASVTAVCTPTAAASGLASAAPAGTVIFNCAVTPSSWVGGVSLGTDTQAVLAVSGLTTGAFSLALVNAGVAQTYPATTDNATSP
jgi:hypothetical protein